MIRTDYPCYHWYGRCVEATASPGRAILAAKHPAPGVGGYGGLREGRDRWACVDGRLDVPALKIGEQGYERGIGEIITAII